MNKKLATILFLAGGTIVNLALMLIFIIGLLAGTSAILKSMGYEPGSSIYIPFLIGDLLGGIALAFFAYSRILKYIQNRFDLEKYLAPIFPSRRKR